MCSCFEVIRSRYKKNCAKLLAQLKAAINLTKDVVPDVIKFMAEYRVSLIGLLLIVNVDR